MKRFFAAFVTIIVSATLVFFLLTQTLSKSGVENGQFYVGVAFNGDTVAEAKLLVDRVKDYTNLFVLGSSPVSRNETATDEVCDYATNQGLNIIVNFGYYNPNPSSPGEAFRQWPWQHAWVEAAKQKYGNRLLGVYYDDEPGGTNLDYDWTQFFAIYSHYAAIFSNTTLGKIYAKFAEAQASGTLPDNYDLEAEFFDSILKSAFYHTGSRGAGAAGIVTMTSDYALYWFDYLGGYDVVLTELGWNHSVAQDIALVKGAARLQNKQWGAIITWKYDQPPYLDTGEAIYDQMVQAYQAGATYITIFDYPTLPGNEYGVMQDEHFAALEKFWNDVVQPDVGKTLEYDKPDVALVLPKNYGWGMRAPNDRIWGMWGPDDKSPQIWNISHALLSEYDLRLDIVYDDPAFPLAGKYNKVYYWNETVT